MNFNRQIRSFVALPRVFSSIHPDSAYYYFEGSRPHSPVLFLPRLWIVLRLDFKFSILQHERILIRYHSRFLNKRERHFQRANPFFAFPGKVIRSRIQKANTEAGTSLIRFMAGKKSKRKTQGRTMTKPEPIDIRVIKLIHSCLFFE